MHKFVYTYISRTCRACFPADARSLDATSSVAASRDASVLLFEALARLGGAFGARRLRRRPPSAAAAFGGGLASLGLAELRKWLNSAGA